MFLIPDKTITLAVGGKTLTVKQKIIPDSLRANKDVAGYIKRGQPMKPCAPVGTTGDPQGICVHNTPDIKVAAGTNAAEQYSRATFNGNMRGVVVHFYVWKDEIWQLLRLDERGWHAADGRTRRAGRRIGQRIGGNLDTISIEAIGPDRETVDTTALLCACLCQKFKFDPALDIWQHYDFSGKNCPEYIRPRWAEFINTVAKFLNGEESVAKVSQQPAERCETPAAPMAKMTEAQRSFIALVGKAAQADSNILPSLTIAQAILESGWGRSELAQKANALFGIKAGTGWKGPRYSKRTTEHIDGKSVEITAAFRSYDSWESSIADHSALLRAARYKAVQGERDYKAACRAVHAAGYATGPDYADKLIRLIEQYDLTQWDCTPTPIEHVVAQGDTLWSLAVKHLGSGHRWIEIQDLNGGPEKCDPHKLRIGSTLLIPTNGGGA